MKQYAVGGLNLTVNLTRFEITSETQGLTEERRPTMITSNVITWTSNLIKEECDLGPIIHLFLLLDCECSVTGWSLRPANHNSGYGRDL